MPETLAELTTALADRYRIERELGRGGMATVYLARDLKHDRDVAIKVLHPELGAALGAERFLREIKTHRAPAAPAHPAAARLRRAPTGTLYYVMPFVEGESLRDRLEREQAAADRRRGAHRARGRGRAATTRTRTASSTATSSRRTSCCTGGHAVVADFGIALAVEQRRRRAHHADRDCRSARRST